jgi:hypothetical protein
MAIRMNAEAHGPLCVSRLYLANLRFGIGRTAERCSQGDGGEE